MGGGGGGKGDTPPRNSKNLKEKVGLCVWKKMKKMRKNGKWMTMDRDTT